MNAVRAWQLLLLVFLLTTVGPLTARAQDAVPQVVDIFWKESATVQIPGVTKVLVLDDSMSRAEISGGKIDFFGLARGETVAFAWIGEQRLTLRLRIAAHPAKPSSRPKLSSNALDLRGNGIVGSSIQMAIGPKGDTTYFLAHHLDWQQVRDGKRFAIRTQAQNSTAVGVPKFNLNSATISYETARTKLTLMDFPLEVNGGMQAKVSMYSAYNVYPIRGASLALLRGANRYEMFGGTTIPSYFRSLRGTREIAGLNFTRKQSRDLSLYTTTGWVNSPIAGSSASLRGKSVFQTAGFSYRPNPQWALQATGGASTRGSLAQGAASYTGGHVTAFLSATRSSPDFPLNQLQLLFSGGSSISAGATASLTARLAGSFSFQHSQTQASVFVPEQAASDNYSSSLNFAMTSRQALTLNHTYSRGWQGKGATPSLTRNQRFDFTHHSVFAERISNTVQLTVGNLSDPYRLRSQGEFSIREALSFPIGTMGSVTVGLQHVRRDPLLVTRLNERINLLPPELQQSFLLNPTGFVQSPELPAEIRALIESLQPTATQFTVAGQFHAGRLSISPSAGYSRNASGMDGNSRSQLLGYSLSYQLSSTLQLTSSLSNTFFFDPAKQSLLRNSVVAVGFQKSFSGAPRWLSPFGSRRGVIRGRLFRDLNVNGDFNTEEPGIAGMRVELDKGKSVLSDSEGRFEFSGLDPGFYRVRVPLSQFDQAVRLTGPAEMQADLNEDRAAEVNFGVVNFARLIGNVFNDYGLEGKRQPDANGLRNIRLKLAGNGVTRELTTDGAGDYGLYDIAPGDYELSLDRSTLPPNFLDSGEPVHIHVEPITTVVQDIPVRALRSISGHVYAKRNDAEGIARSGSSGSETDSPALQPLAGVQLRIDDKVAITGADGSFVLRDLRSGELMLSVVPSRALPTGLTVPSGRVILPREPIHVEDATIIISNPDLPQYLLAAFEK